MIFMMNGRLFSEAKNVLGNKQPHGLSGGPVYQAFEGG